MGCVLLDGFPAWVVVLHVSRGVVPLAIRTSERVLHTRFFCPRACGRGGAHGSAGQGRAGQTRAALVAGETQEGGPEPARRPCLEASNAGRGCLAQHQLGECPDQRIQPVRTGQPLTRHPATQLIFEGRKHPDMVDFFLFVES